MTIYLLLKQQKCYPSVMTSVESDSKTTWHAPNQYPTTNCPMGEALCQAWERKKADILLPNYKVS